MLLSREIGLITVDRKCGLLNHDARINFASANGEHPSCGSG
jgi:hypothetical protein